MKRRYLIYVAGPFRAKTQWQIERNCRIADEASLEVWKAGHVGVCPHQLGRLYYGELCEDDVLCGLLELLSRCDGVLLLPKWNNSTGTLIEKSLAEKLKIPCMRSLPNLLEKIKKNKK